jgi:oligoendopeptidase F
MSSVPEREELDEDVTWDLETVFESEDEWVQALEEVREEITELADAECETFEQPEQLLETLEHRDAVLRQVSTLAAYARMRRDEDTRDQEAQARLARARSLMADAGSAASFVEPAIQSLTEAQLDDLIEAEPDLESYEHYLRDVLRMKVHTRSAEVESLLAELSEVTVAPGEIYGMLTNADMTFPTVERPDGEPVEVSLSNFTTLQQEPDRDFRRRVYESFYDEWETVRNTVGTAYEKTVTTNVKLADARHYDSARAAALDEPNVPVAVYDTLVETIQDNLDVLHRHARLKRRVLDVDELQMWDLYMPTVPEESPSVPYEDACEYVRGAVGALGDEYQSRLAEGIDSGWIDVYENRGKRSGAYSSGSYDTQPFILMNYQEDVSSMFTLAHELGHSLHSQLTSEHQPYVYSDYEIFVAEVASTVNEALLTEHLLETVDDDRLRRHVLSQSLERFRSTLFRQTMFAMFEQRTHELVENDEALTPDVLDECYRELKTRFYEPVAVDDRIAREWMRIPHFFNAFYVYQYATGISAAQAIASDILTDGEPAAQRYLDFLKQGSRGYPLDLLAEAGVDMRSADPIEQAIDTYEDRIDQLEQLV